MHTFPFCLLYFYFLFFFNVLCLNGGSIRADGDRISAEGQGVRAFLRMFLFFFSWLAMIFFCLFLFFCNACIYISDGLWLSVQECVCTLCFIASDSYVFNIRAWVNSIFWWTCFLVLHSMIHSRYLCNINAVHGEVCAKLLYSHLLSESVHSTVNIIVLFLAYIFTEGLTEIW